MAHPKDYQVPTPKRQEKNYMCGLSLSVSLGKLIAKEHGGIMRFIQMSCLGASASSPSRMLRTKAASEESVLRVFPEATIMRPSTVIGTEDRVLNRWAQFVKKWGFLPLIGDGSTKYGKYCFIVDFN
ncbi:NADH dehydrogenase [ubiquinone] 1 alpha subcomplex subunit 9, mitochondrial [Dendrobium catenatum]|uniref:NADH dehydrogenase [ubiquinone] 1 alpha subcomplex subunit 9, mitochondrial n=1 Tax=Dendrobium catenatum TaxID=906689 RepID=A0A2I0VTI2_9ASPA|nr:NADH dehydrogenase [ubiquinone] 1 alpha subcomplex subunit 9, mitochondrial [Dendrobium catenatum]